jgi:uncharacterized protein YegL
MRKLPVYLVIDCSHSMRGEPIQTINEGLAAFASDLLGNPFALETVAVSLITFSTEAELKVPLSEVLQLRIPELEAGGKSDLGAALRLVADRVALEVQRASPTRKGDWKPMIFVLSDGAPSGAWITPAKAIRSLHDSGKATVVAFGYGPKVRRENLQRITPTVLLSPASEPESLGRFLKWVTQAVSQSCSVAQADTRTSEKLPQVPVGIVHCSP